jgi:hypothetical protein
MFARRASFWLAVGGVSLISQVLLEVATEHWPDSGLAKLTAYAHRGEKS